jgi:predicted transposase YdaD
MHDLQESTTYQAILREGLQKGIVEGRVAGEQQILVRQGTKRFGKSDAATRDAIEAIRDIERPEALADRIVDADMGNWSELLRNS